MTKLKLFFSIYILTVLALFFYSFTQVDLSLTLSRISIYQTAEKILQYVGFYQRPLSTAIFVFIALLLFVFYLLFLYFVKKGEIGFKHLKILIGLTFVLLVFSYNAFSYDLFNYIFDAKILTVYHLNPYLYKALDFPHDPMLNFMRWTHRTYPYGPSWLILTVPLSFIGMDIFLPTFFLFKILMGLSFLGSAYLIYKISEKLFPEHKLFNLAFWAFNPLVIIESLVSAHNDLPMIFFMLLSVYLFLQKKRFWSFLSWVFSIGIKFSTGILAPMAFFLWYADKKEKKIDWEKFFIISMVLCLITVFAATYRSTFQQWYLLLPLALSAFVAKKRYIFIPCLTASVFAVAMYIPYVFMTDYAKGYPQILANIEILGLITVTVVTVLTVFSARLLSKH